MNLYARPGGTKAAVLLLIGLLGLFFLWAWVARAERPGDTVELSAFCRDSLGVAIVPSAATLYVFRDSSIVQSSQTLAGGKIKLGQTLRMKAKYTIPATAPDSSRYSFAIRATGDDITDYVWCTPASVLVHDGTVDSLSPASVVDLLVGDSDSNFALIDSTDAGGIYQSSTPVTGAFVFACSEQYLINVIGVTTSTLGNYYLRFPVDPVAADTVYVSAWYQGSWVKTSTVIYP